MDTGNGDNDFLGEDAGYGPIPGLPSALVKAFHDSFWFALGLRTGQIIIFESATLSRDGVWVHLNVASRWDSQARPMAGVDHCFERGIDVRLSDIVWVADAPDGS